MATDTEMTDPLYDGFQDTKNGYLDQTVPITTLGNQPTTSSSQISLLARTPAQYGGFFYKLIKS